MRHIVEHEAAYSNGTSIVRSTVFEDTEEYTWNVFVDTGGALTVTMYRIGFPVPGSKTVYGPGRWLTYTEDV